MRIGIDQIGFYTPNKYVAMVDLAHARGEDPNKFLIGIGQIWPSWIPTVDIANSAARLLAKPILVITLAKSFTGGEDPNKFLIGIGQRQMSVADKTQDAVSMGIKIAIGKVNSPTNFWSLIIHLLKLV